MRMRSGKHAMRAMCLIVASLAANAGVAMANDLACDAEVIGARGPFFIACLQREGDVQLLRYSRYADNAAFLAAVMDSFALHAPADRRLVVKNHPLDPGLVDLAAVTRPQ